MTFLLPRSIQPDLIKKTRLRHKPILAVQYNISYKLPVQTILVTSYLPKVSFKAQYLVKPVG